MKKQKALEIFEIAVKHQPVVIRCAKHNVAWCKDPKCGMSHLNNNQRSENFDNTLISF